jgi:hypothetical protein
MLNGCKCGENKVVTEVDGRFAYQVCAACKEIINFIYLGPKPEEDDSIDESLLGI